MRIDLKQLEFIAPMLRTILTETEVELGCEFTVTSLYRIGDAGVHGQLPLRGIDWRCRDPRLGELVCTHINSRWLYDHVRPEMQCAIPHGAGSNYHIHVQVHDNTIAR